MCLDQKYFTEAEKFSIFFRTYLVTHNIQEKYDTHIPDLSAQVTAYKESIKLGHGAIVIKEIIIQMKLMRS